MTLPHAEIIIHDASQIISPPHEEAGPLRGKKMGELFLYNNSSIATGKDGTILAVAPWNEIKNIVTVTDETITVNGAGKIVLPGFIDPHTHPVYAGSRVDEFLMRSQGKSYMEIHKAGGGIQKTVSKTRNASQKELYASAYDIFSRMLSHGTTTVEAKSGYGLNIEDEIKLLETLNKLNVDLPIEIHPTFMGAHDFPPEYASRRREFVNLIIYDLIPKIRENNLAKYCDVFCDEGAFTEGESRPILLAAKNAGLIPKIHADEFASIGGTELAIELEASSADHLLKITPSAISKLAASKTGAVLLPGTSFFLNLDHYAPARDLINSGAFVAIGTDFNAGSCLTESMQMICSLAVMKMKFTPEEAINAATVNAACTLGIENRVSKIIPGYQADLIILDISDYKEFPYHFGVNLVKTVIKNGKVVRNNA